MTRTDAIKTVRRLRKAGILATVEVWAWKSNHQPDYMAKEAGTAKGQDKPRQWTSPIS
jgi:hypothetical protein